MTALTKLLGIWIRLISEYTIAHFAGRLLAASSALLLINLLPKGEYGFYTIVLAAFSFICTFSDLGATETLSFFRWRSIKKNKSWLPYFHTILKFRRTIFVVGYLTSVGYVCYTAYHIGETAQAIFLNIVLMGLGAWFAIKSAIISYVLKLERYFRYAYMIELSNEAVKLLAVSLIWTLGLATALAGMVSIVLGAVLAAMLATWFFEQHVAKIIKQSLRRAYRNRLILLSQIIPILPGTIYFSLQGPLTTWLAAHYGSVESVAEVGALGRLGVLIGMISGFTGTVFIPRLTAVSSETIFFRYYLLWWGAIIILGSVIMVTVSIFPRALLFVLGNSYSGLYTELMITVATAVISTWLAFAWHINRARGWVKYQPLRVPMIIMGQIPLFLVLDFSTTQGVLIFGFLTFVLDLSFQIIINVLGFVGKLSTKKLIRIPNNA